MSEVKNKVCLIAIDGWGISAEQEGNAVYHAKTPFMDGFEKKYPVKFSSYFLSFFLNYLIELLL